MRNLGVSVLALLMATTLSAQAQPRDYRTLINKAWPEHRLRADQLEWVARASAHAYQQCRHGGYSQEYCDDLVLQALREQLESEPSQAALWSTRHAMR